MAAPSCIVLVPVGGLIDPHCEQALHALERRGYVVRRVQGYSAIDLGRSTLASEALAEGFQELMWVDSDVIFYPDDVDKLRSHGQPFVCGIYAKKSRPEFACTFLPGTPRVTFGREGGLYEICYSGFGFVLTRREVFEKMRTQLALPRCNERFGKPFYPYFLPLVVPDKEGSWYLSEDYAFCERARRCGYRVLADTTIRLWHVGSYGYTWEDIANPRERLANLNVNMNWVPGQTPGGQPDRPERPPES